MEVFLLAEVGAVRFGRFELVDDGLVAHVLAAVTLPLCGAESVPATFRVRVPEGVPDVRRWVDELLAQPERLFQEPEQDAAEPEALSALSREERHVLSLVAAGADFDEASAHLGVPERAFAACVGGLLRKLGAKNRVQLAVTAVLLGVRPAEGV